MAVAPEGAVHVAALAVGAHPGLAALIVVDALGFISGGVEASVALAVEAALRVPTVAPPAHPLQALVGVPALLVSRHLKALGAVAAVAFLSVHTLAVGTEIRPERALVNPGDADGRLLAQQPVLLCPPRRAGGAEVLPAAGPALAHCLAAAAVHPGELEGHLATALATARNGGVAGPLPGVQTAPPVLGRDEAGVADAVEAGIRVDTPEGGEGDGYRARRMLVLHQEPLRLLSFSLVNVFIYHLFIKMYVL